MTADTVEEVRYTDGDAFDVVVRVHDVNPAQASHPTGLEYTANDFPSVRISGEVRNTYHLHTTARMVHGTRDRSRYEDLRFYDTDLSHPCYAGWETSQNIDCFAVGCMIGEMIDKGTSVFCRVPEGPSYLREKLAVLYHRLSPVNQTIGEKIERCFPGMVDTSNYRYILTRPDMSESVENFIGSTISINVSTSLPPSSSY